MDQKKRPGINKKVVLIVCFSAVIFLAAGIAVGLWSAMKMREQMALRQALEDRDSFSCMVGASPVFVFISLFM
jgi:CHASE3 domain sensor protein